MGKGISMGCKGVPRIQLQIAEKFIKRIKYKMELSVKKNQARNKKWKKYDYLNGEKENQNFLCECGKKYKTFPGLYLHFQRTHSQKISTRPTESQCTNKITPLGQTFVYHILSNRQQQKILTNSSEKFSQSVKKIFEDYYNSGRKEIEATFPDSLAQECKINNTNIQKLNDFYSFLGKEEEYISSGLRIETIPSYFNLYVLQKRKEEDFTLDQEEKTCELLFGFWEWLFQNNLTKLVIQYETQIEENLVSYSGQEPQGQELSD